MPAKKVTSAGKSIKGWFMAGAQPSEFSAELDTSTCHSGRRSARIFSNEKLSAPSSWGTLMQQMSPDEYLDKRVRMTIWVKAGDVQGWLSPWMRVDGERHGEMLSFDNFCTRKIKGTADWAKHEIVLDVPSTSSNVAYGVMLGGKGEAWIDDISFEIVDKDVSVTDCPCNSKNRAKPATNLDFEED